jgi:subtilase family serine protease
LFFSNACAASLDLACMGCPDDAQLPSFSFWRQTLRSLPYLFSAAILATLAAGPAGASTFSRASIPVRLSAQGARVTVTLPLRNSAELDDLLRVQADPSSPQYRRFLSVSQFRANFAPSAATFDRVIGDLHAKGLQIDAVSTKTIHVSGAIRTVAAAFGTTIGARRFTREGRVRLVAMTPLHLDAVLKGAGATVTGLDSRPSRQSYAVKPKLPTNRYSAVGPYWFTDLKQAYAYPADELYDGKGATIGIVISNDVLNSDLADAFNHEKFTVVSGKPVPKIVRRPVDGGSQFDANDSFESSLDVQTSLGSAPGARVLFYNLPDLTDQSVQDGYEAVVEDDVADVISSSFGLCELYYLPAYNGGEDFTSILTAERDTFKQGNAQGQTFVASSGDNAGLPCASLSYFNGNASNYVPGVSDPASDPNVTAVGGTNLVTLTPNSATGIPASKTSQYLHESAYADPLESSDPYDVGAPLSGGFFGSGSGSSAIWAKPYSQNYVNTGTSKMRAVPDISMQMGGCPVGAISCGADDSYYLEYDGGQLYGVIGTSVSSPEFAGLLAVAVGIAGTRLGNINPYLYLEAAANQALPSPVFHNRIPGNNGVVSVSSAALAYNPILGVGTPITVNTLLLPPSIAKAQVPQTISNP